MYAIRSYYVTTVENGDGKRLEDVLIKNFEDGSVCVVSLLDTPQGEVMLKQAGSKPFSFELSENGVFTCSPVITSYSIHYTKLYESGSCWFSF